MRSRRGAALVLMVALTATSVLAVAGSSRLSGPVLWTITEPRPGHPDGHGVHLDDLFVVALWLAGLVTCWRLWRE